MNRKPLYQNLKGSRSSCFPLHTLFASTHILQCFWCISISALSVSALGVGRGGRRRCLSRSPGEDRNELKALSNASSSWALHPAEMGKGLEANGKDEGAAAAASGWIRPKRRCLRCCKEGYGYWTPHTNASIVFHGEWISDSSSMYILVSNQRRQKGGTVHSWGEGGDNRPT